MWINTISLPPVHVKLMVFHLITSVSCYRVNYEDVKIHFTVSPSPLWYTKWLPCKMLFTKIINAFLISDTSAPWPSANIWQTPDDTDAYDTLCGCLTALATQQDLECDSPKFSICRSCVWMLSWTSSSDNRAVAISSNCGPLQSVKANQSVY